MGSNAKSFAKQAAMKLAENGFPRNDTHLGGNNSQDYQQFIRFMYSLGVQILGQQDAYIQQYFGARNSIDFLKCILAVMLLEDIPKRDTSLAATPFSDHKSLRAWIALQKLAEPESGRRGCC